MLRVINEHDGSKVYTIERKCLTYAQIMEELEREGVKVNDIQLCNAQRGAPAFARLDEHEAIYWGEAKELELFAYEREYPVTVTTFNDNGVSSTERTLVFNLLKGTSVGEIRDMFERVAGPKTLPELNYGRLLYDYDTLERLMEENEEFRERPVLIGYISVNVADEKCNQMRHMAVSPNVTAGYLWRQFVKHVVPPRMLHSREGPKGKPVPLCREDDCDPYNCRHTWLYHGGRVLEIDEPLNKALGLLPEESQKIVYYAAPPFMVTIKEKSEKNEDIETKIEIEDSNTIAEVRNKYSRNAEEGLVEGDLLLMDDQELKEDRMVFTYAIRSNSALYVQKRSANQPMFTYICADCGNDLRLRKDEKIRCRECGHRVVYKPRLNKPLQHFAR